MHAAVTITDTIAEAVEQSPDAEASNTCISDASGIDQDSRKEGHPEDQENAGSGIDRHNDDGSSDNNISGNEDEEDKDASNNNSWSSYDSTVRMYYKDVYHDSDGYMNKCRKFGVKDPEYYVSGDENVYVHDHAHKHTSDSREEDNCAKYARWDHWRNGGQHLQR